MTPHAFRPEPVDRRGFSLVELLVVVSIMLVLMAMVGGGVAAARGSQKRQATQALITKLDVVLDQQFATYASRSVPASVLTGTGSKSAARASYLRKLASAEMPDNWVDVKAIASGSAGVPRTAPQNAYAAVYQAINSANSANPTADYADAECLFMIVMQGGIADCLECSELKSSDKGDVDGDGAFEFLDDWGNPIRYVLWPAGFELPPGTGRFFSTTAPFSAGTPQFAKGGTMRPLLFSGGADQRNSILVNGGGNLALGDACGDPANATVATFGGRDPSGADGRTDNITNFDAEAAK
jgi:prepilin-type N-terminal cleavage/methylation domain-containing protein